MHHLLAVAPARSAHAVLASLLVAVVCTVPLSASANPEPHAYDTRSVGMGLSGISYLERPAAIAMNPAMLEGIDRFSISILANPFTINQVAPVQGAGSSVASDRGFGPLTSIFFAGRIAPRVVLGGGVYLETAYGSNFSDIVGIDGVASNGTPEDLRVVFMVGEAALGTSIKLSDKVNIGVALRVPFARQNANLLRNIGPVIQGLGINTGKAAIYSNANSKLSGVGYPSARFGISYRPNSIVTVGAAYRPYARIPLKGQVETDFFPTAKARSDWTLPHALQAGVAVHLLRDKLLIAVEERVQFHNAPRTGNDAQVVHATVDLGGTETTTEVFLPLDWRTLASTKIGIEYQVNRIVALRAGTSLGFAATRERFANYFTPPPGFSWLASLGLGFNWKHVDLDFAAAYATGGATIGSRVADQGPVTFRGRTFELCSNDQVTRTGCAGKYKVSSYWSSLTLTYRL